LHTAAVPVRIHKINKVIDASEAHSQLVKERVDRHDVADLVLETQTPVAFDTVGDNEATGRFVIVDGYEIAGGGIIVSAETEERDELRFEARMRDFHWVQGGVGANQRAQRHGHRAGLVMFVGGAEAPKHQYARALEKALFDGGRNAYMLDGTNILLGIDADLHFVDATQRELVRRFTEVAFLLLDAGTLVISTTNAIGLADYGDVQALLGDATTIIIDVDPDGKSTAPCDLRISGREPEAEVIAKVVDLLGKRQITQV
jgi:bifunctional enzyme CysN/CysC